MQKTIKLDDNVNLNGYTVLFPSVCVGNAAQLAIDLLIATQQMKKCATVWHSSIIPVLGPRAYEHKVVDDESSPDNNITTACELFISESQRLACFQLRSPLVSDNRINSFFDDLKVFLREQQITKLIIVTGSFSHEQHSIGTPKFMYLANEQFKTLCKTELGSDRWCEWVQNSNNVIHGGGFALKLYKSLAADVPVCVFFKYISEGDNRNDAVDILQELNALQTGLLKSKENENLRLIVPVSWKAMFGNDPIEQLY